MTCQTRKSKRKRVKTLISMLKKRRHFRRGTSWPQRFSGGTKEKIPNGHGFLNGKEELKGLKNTIVWKRETFAYVFDTELEDRSPNWNCFIKSWLVRRNRKERESKQSLHPFLSLSNSQVESTGLCSRKYSESSELQLLKTFNWFPQVHLVMKQSVD